MAVVKEQTKRTEQGRRKRDEAKKKLVETQHREDTEYRATHALRCAVQMQEAAASAQVFSIDSLVIRIRQ
jgi:hypothetical protein